VSNMATRVGDYRAAEYGDIGAITEGIKQTYNTHSGTDIFATIDGILVANLNGISFSTTREKAPVYVMGSVDAVSFGRGKRGHAGSLVFTNFDRDALYDIKQGTFENKDTNMQKRYFYYAKKTDLPAGGRSKFLGKTLGDMSAHLGSELLAPNYSDQLPPFTITLTGANEYGNVSAMHILGAELINEGSGVSIDDIVTETQMTFVARAIIPWSPISRDGSFSAHSVLTQINSLAAVRQAEAYGTYERSSRFETASS